MTNWERVVARYGIKGDRATVRCAAHDDREASLSVKRHGDDVLTHCFAGCSWKAVRDALGLERRQGVSGRRSPEAPNPPRRKVIASYQYRDLAGDVIAVKQRWEPKTFSWLSLREDGQYRQGFPEGMTQGDLPPYQLPLAVAAAKAGHPLVVVEGEKSTDALISLGLAALCGPEGASGAASAYEPNRYRPFFPPGTVFALWPDRDAPGEQHMTRLAGVLIGLGYVVHRVPNHDLPEKGDAFDFIAGLRAQGADDGAIAEAVAYQVAHAPRWLPESAPNPLPASAADVDAVTEAALERAGILRDSGVPSAQADALAWHGAVTARDRALAALPVAARLAHQVDDPWLREMLLELA